MVFVPSSLGKAFLSVAVHPIIEEGAWMPFVGEWVPA